MNAKNASRKTLVGAWILILGVVFFYTAEFIASLGWKGPARYSYISDFISSLGIPVVLEQINSPLHALMNIGFVIYGASVVIGYLLLKKTLPKGKLSALVRILLAASGIGVVLVGFFPGHDWTYSFVHTVGAMLVIYAGNVGDILLSLALWREKRFRYAPCGVLLGIVGLFFSVVMAMFFESGFAGLYERLAIYPTILFNLALGIRSLRGVKKDKAGM